MKISRERFFKKAGELFDEYNLIYINLATVLAGKIHYGQTRSTGEGYFEHLIRVAYSVMVFGRQPMAYQVIVALLHDAIEDCILPKNLIKVVFDEGIDSAVRILSKKVCIYNDSGMVIDKQKMSDEKYFSQICLSPAWIREIKIADRLDNINSMHVWKKSRQRKYLQETETYILPIATMTYSPLSRKLEKKYEELKKKLL